MRYKDYACPVPYTCPLIDSVINEHIKWAINCIEGVVRQGDETDAALKEIADILLYFDPIPILEQIRESNHEIRTWGEAEAKRAIELEEEVSGLQEEVDDLKKRIADLEEEVDDLERTIDEMDAGDDD